jgi:uncharacterized Ntn-hydrolase superfamily protein
VTFSIVARSPDRRLFGVAIASSSPAVAARCAHARAGVGAAASQNITDPSLGAAVLAAISRGATAAAALRACLDATSFADYRQLLVIAREGTPAVHTGAYALGIAASAIGAHAAAAGNLLADDCIPAAMIAAFEGSSGHLGARLLRALSAALERGGETGPIHSAGVLIVREVPWPIVDLRVDWAEDDPVAELHAAWEIYAPQIEDYVRRALDPHHAPGFGGPHGGAR